ncbi:MAG: CDP-glycerol glycerophosphotransferase family protein [Clostridia bacterium]|nr:CDP-glycerol glycerophosphotransferase family protein [Clostridia bacterium]
MGYDTMKERRALAKELDQKQHELRLKNQHDDWLADSVFPSLYAQCSRKPINPKLVVFAGTKSEKLPYTMRSLFTKLTEQGYTCRYFGVPSSFKNRKAEFAYYKEFFASYGVCKCLYIDDIFAPVYCVEPRAGQHVVQLWHTPALLRKAGYAIGKRGVAGEIVDRRLVHKNYTDVVASSGYVKNTLASVFNCSEDIIHGWGCAHTDVYFDKEFIRKSRHDLVRLVPNLTSQIGDRKILLYAPTYRGENDHAYTHRMLDLLLLKRLLGDKFVLLIRMHPLIQDGSLIVGDMRDLVHDFAFEVPQSVSIDATLCGSDMLITDYSTILFEYSLLGRPMVFYAFDFEQYTRRRPLFYDYASFVPGPIVYDSAQLSDAVLDMQTDFDEEQIRHFARKYMGGCDGHSTERIIHYTVKK